MNVSARNYVKAFAAAAVIAVSVSACGGNGPNNGPPKPMYVDVDLSDLMPNASTNAGRFNIDEGTYVDRGDVRFLCADGGGDCTVMVEVADDGTITAAEYLETGGMVTAVDVPPPPVKKKDVDLSTVTVGFWAKATMMLKIEKGESKNHGDIRFSCASGGEDCVVMVMVADDGTITALYSDSGGEVTASNAGEPNTMRDQLLDAAINAGHSTNSPILENSGAAPGYTAMTDAVVADIDDGWTSSVQELETPAMGMTPAMTDTLVIYSNRDYEMAVDFAVGHPLNTNMDSSGEYQSLTVDSGNVSQVSDVSEFPSTANSTTTVSMNVGVTGLEGKFDGADGEYWCNTGSGCVVETDADGNLNVVTGDMYFTPAAGATVDVPDPDYLYFGYWLRESEDSNGDPAFEIAGVYGGELLSLHADVMGLKGRAEYKGAATGLYVRRWTDANNDVLRRRAGQFTADVALLANFGGGDIAPNDQFMIGGAISNFMDGERPIDSSWNLQLETANISYTNVTETLFAGSTQVVDENGMATGSAGGWNGQFFGEVTVDDPGTPDVDESVYPSGVAGGFQGDFPNGDVIGAFGAERQDQE